MEYRRLGTSGLVVSPLCLGTMLFGGRTPERVAGRIIASALDSGVNFIDTADNYVKGESERIVGRHIKAHRHQWVLATKMGNRMGPGVLDFGIGRGWMMRAIDASLTRLGTDHVDIFYLHRDDLVTPLEETIDAMGDLIRAGKVRYWGFSNFESWKIGEMIRVCQQLGVPRPVVSQPYYNAMNRMPEVDYLPACHFYGIGVAPYSPVARGVLTGKYELGREMPAKSRAAAKDERILQTEFREESLVMAAEIVAHAEKRGMTGAQFATNWVLNNTIVSSVIAGPRTLGQWKEYVGALNHPFTAEDEALIDRLVPAGHPSTPGYTDPKALPTGRKALTAV